MNSSAAPQPKYSPRLAPVRAALAVFFIAAACWLSVAYLSAGRMKEKHLSGQPDWIADWGLGCGAAALLICALGIPRVVPRFSPFALGAAATHLVIAGLVKWNQAYTTFAPRRPYIREVFRNPLVTRGTTPIYGDIEHARSDQIMLAVVLGTLAMALAVFVLRDRLRRPLVGIGWGLLFALSAIATLLLASAESNDRLIGNTTSYHNFSQDLVDFKGPRDLLSTYVQKMPTLGQFGQHYPPGFLLLFRAQEGLRDGNTSVRQAWSRFERHQDEGDHGPEPDLPPQGFIIALVMLGALGSLPVFAALGRELGMRRVDARAAAMIVALGAGVMVYPTVSPLSLLLLPAAGVWWSFQRGLRTGTLWCGILAGVLLYVFAFFSFSVTLIGLVMTAAMIAQVLSGSVRWKRAAILCLVTGGTGVLVWLSMKFATGYDALACLRAAVKGHARQQQSNPYSPAYMWWLRSTGNLLAYLFSAAPVFGAGLALLMRRRLNHANCWLIGTAIAIAVGSFGGLFWLETERIWIFFTPLLALAGCEAIARLVPRELRFETRLALLAFSVAMILTFETCFKPYI